MIDAIGTYAYLSSTKEFDPSFLIKRTRPSRCLSFGYQSNRSIRNYVGRTSFIFDNYILASLDAFCERLLWRYAHASSFQRAQGVASIVLLIWNFYGRFYSSKLKIILFSFFFFLNKEFSLLPYKHNSVTFRISGSIKIFFIIKIKKIMIPMNFCYYIEEQKNILIYLIFAEQSYLIKS